MHNVPCWSRGLQAPPQAPGRYVVYVEPGIVDLTWRMTRTGQVLVLCSGCRRWMGLQNHGIEADGRLTPSFWCPWEKIDKSCTFHRFVSLRNWWQNTCRR